MKDGIKYKGVIKDPRDGETVAIEIATVRDGAHSSAEGSAGAQDTSTELSPVGEDLQDSAIEPSTVDVEPVIAADAEPSLDETPVVLSGKYAAIRDAARQRAQRLAANLGPAASVARTRLAEGARQLGDAAAIAAEEYQGGKPKPRRPKPKPKPHPRVAEFEDKYRRIRDLFRAAAPETQAARPRRSRNAGMKTRTARVPSVKVVTKR